MNILHTLSCRFSIALFLSFVCNAVFAQGYPNKPIKFIVPYAPGGVGDLTARIVAQKMSENLGQPVVIDNRPGAGMIAGTEVGAKAEPDGYTMVLTGNGHTLTYSLFKTLPFDITKDFTHVSSIGFFDLVLFTHPNSGINSVQDLIRLAKANPGKVNIGTINIGSTQNLAGELFKSMAGIDAAVIPYKATADVITAVASQSIQVGVEIMAPMMGPIKGGTVKTIATTSNKRFAAFPNVPTVIESGLPGYEASSWNGISVPARTPAAVVERLNKAILFALNSTETKTKMLEMGVDSRGSTPDEMRDLILSDIKKWRMVIDRANIARQ
jgi:tripartite-type tricarboxylate transporter receptor subunit TctC